MPVPVSAIFCGLVRSESAMVMNPFLIPVALGVKVTWIKHLAFAATDEPQVFT